jgi:hypothetical protein
MRWPFIIMAVGTTWVETVVADTGHIIEKAGAHGGKFWSTKRYTKRKSQAAQPPEDCICTSQFVMREGIAFTAIAEAHAFLPQSLYLKVSPDQ